MRQICLSVFIDKVITLSHDVTSAFRSQTGRSSNIWRRYRCQGTQKTTSNDDMAALTRCCLHHHHPWPVTVVFRCSWTKSACSDVNWIHLQLAWFSLILSHYCYCYCSDFLGSSMSDLRHQRAAAAGFHHQLIVTSQTGVWRVTTCKSVHCPAQRLSVTNWRQVSTSADQADKLHTHTHNNQSTVTNITRNAWQSLAYSPLGTP